MKKIKKYLFVLFIVFAGCSQSYIDINAQTISTSYKVDTISHFPNPERGWVMTVNPNSNDTQAPALNPEDLHRWKSGEEKVTLIRKYYLLNSFLNSPISPEYLETLQNDANTCREAGFKLIPRFTYKWTSSSTSPDASLEYTVYHIQQLKNYFQNNWDIIAFVECGFVGKYGEWHHTDQNYIDNYSNQIKPDGFTVRDSLLSVIPKQRFLAMRYMFWHKMVLWPDPLKIDNAFDWSFQSRIGYHHDYMMGGNRWQAPNCEICPDFSTMLNYYKSDTRWVPSTGEPVCNDPYFIQNDPRSQFRELHISTFMNNACNISAWKQLLWYSDLTRDLGYRISLISSEIDKRIRRGGILNLNLKLINTGYAAPFNERKFEIILKNRSTGTEFVSEVTHLNKFKTDPRYWIPGEHIIKISFKIPDDLDVGNYSLHIHLSDPAPELRSRPDYSIRFANVGVWDESTGYNSLLVNVDIKK